jgi:HEAT repeat protein
VESLVNDLHNPDYQAQVNAAEDLGRLGPKACAAVPDLLLKVTNSNDLVARSAKDAIDAICLTDISPLADALSDERPNVRFAAAMEIPRMGSRAKDAVPALVKALDSDDRMFKAAVILALQRMGPAASDALPKLKELMANDPSESVRKECLDAVIAIERRR